MIEEEVFGQLTEEQFNEFKAKFENRFGPPKSSKRIKISYWDPNIDKNFDVQFRITDGEAEIMVKKGEWEGLTVSKMHESNFTISSNIQNVLQCLQTLDTLYGTEYAPNIQQYENLLWEHGGFEVKLGRQFNHQHSNYLFEVELLESESTLDEFIHNLGLKEYALKTDLKFWEHWNKRVNLVRKELTDEEYETLIHRYI